MKYYELLCILPGTLGEDEVGPLVQEVKTLLTDNGATNISSEDRGKSRLAYPIKHIRYGYSVVLAFQAERVALPVIQAKLRLVNNLLRAMINQFDPVMRKEKDVILVKLAKDRAEYEKPRTSGQASVEKDDVAEAPIAPKAVVVEVKPAVEAEVEADEEENLPVGQAGKPAKKAKKASTEKPTEENMSAIEEKLDKVLDSTLEEV